MRGLRVDEGVAADGAGDGGHADQLELAAGGQAGARAHREVGVRRAPGVAAVDEQVTAHRRLGPAPHL
ncbi:MAG: hypothetical protein CVU56_23280, partial [Deltaproteobacteria bacterium HGW-Deltaproteobacteria-14]